MTHSIDFLLMTSQSITPGITGLNNYDLDLWYMISNLLDINLIHSHINDGIVRRVFLTIWLKQLPRLMLTKIRRDSLGHIDGLVQDCCISIANALETLQSFTKPMIWRLFIDGHSMQLNKSSHTLIWTAGTSVNIVSSMTLRREMLSMRVCVPSYLPSSLARRGMVRSPFIWYHSSCREQ